ncbi:MAG: HAD-IB family phosphatase [Acinetobacter sp.]
MNKALALFDFDGTLYLKDSFTQFIFYTLSKGHIAHRGIQILPWINAYFVNLYPAHLMRERLYKQMFKHQDLRHIEPIAKNYSAQIIDSLNPVLLAQLKQHQALGHQVVVVSASLDLYLKYVCDWLNVDLICTQTEVKDAVLTGQYASEDCSGIHKKIQVMSKYKLAEFAQIYAYGNSKEDIDMLSLAHYPFMIGQDRLLPTLN